MPTRPSARIWLGLGLSLLTALLLIATWERYGGLSLLVFIAFVPMIIAQYRVLPRRWSGMPVGIAFAGWWLALLLHGSSLIPIGLSVAVAVGIGVIATLAGSFLRPFTEHTGYRWYLVQLPLLWVIVDLAIQDNEIFGTYTWMAYRLAFAPQIIQPVSILSTPALTFLIIMWNAWLALVIMRAMDRRWPELAMTPIPRPVLAITSTITLTIATAWLVSSLLIYNTVSASMGPTVRVAGIQPGLANTHPSALIHVGPQDTRSLEQRRADQQVQLTEMTVDAAAQGAELVVWPEEILDYDPRTTLTEWIPALARSTGTYLVVGFVADIDDSGSPNMALLYGPDGNVIGSYAKVHRVLAENETFEPGTRFPTFDTAFGPLGLMICFDIDFPDSTPRLVTLTGSRIIAAPSIDFGSLATVRTGSTVFRAVENRVGIVKVDVAWDSAAIAPNGQVVASSLFEDEAGGAAVMMADVPLGPRDAPFTRIGGYAFGVLVTFFFAWMVVAMWTSRRRERRLR